MRPVAIKPANAAEDASRAVAAVETLLAHWLGVVFPVAAGIFLTPVGSTPAMAGLLRTLSAVHVDLVAFYFLLRGWTAAHVLAPHQEIASGERTEVVPAASDAPPAASDAPPAAFDAPPAPSENFTALLDQETPRAVLTEVGPDLVLSGLLHCVWQFALCASCPWDVANALLSLLCLGPFADVRLANVPRGGSEISWVVQDLVLILFVAYDTNRHIHAFLGTPHRLAWGLLAMWVSSFSQLYLGVYYPAYANTGTRSVFSNLLFFTAGMVVYASRGHAALLDPLRPYLRAPVALALGGATAIFYGVRAGAAVSAPHACVSVSGGLPCLWAVDSCSARFMPVHMALLLWLADDGSLFAPWLLGPLAEPLAVTLRHVNSYLTDRRVYNVSWLLYGPLATAGMLFTAETLTGGLVARQALVATPLLVAAVTGLVCLWRDHTHGALQMALDRVYPARR